MLPGVNLSDKWEKESNVKMCRTIQQQFKRHIIMMLTALLVSSQWIERKHIVDLFKAAYKIFSALGSHFNN